jgi:hypothetical protein
MASKTQNFNLTKPSGTDTVDIAAINANMDIIDGALKAAIDNGKMIDEATSANYKFVIINGELYIREV